MRDNEPARFAVSEISYGFSCPTCQARIGRICTNGRGAHKDPLTSPHGARIDRAVRFLGGVLRGSAAQAILREEITQQ